MTKMLMQEAATGQNMHVTLMQLLAFIMARKMGMLGVMFLLTGYSINHLARRQQCKCFVSRKEVLARAASILQDTIKMLVAGHRRRRLVNRFSLFLVAMYIILV
jgi:hypothetical protein